MGEGLNSNRGWRSLASFGAAELHGFDLDRFARCRVVRSGSSSPAIVLGDTVYGDTRRFAYNILCLLEHYATYRDTGE